MQRRVFLGQGLGWGLGWGLAVCASPARAMSPDRPVIRLSCPDGPTGRALCSALTQRLSEAAPRAVIRRVTPQDVAVSRPQDLGVAVQITIEDAQGIGAQLTWQGSTDKTRHQGRDIRVDMMDTGLNPTILRHLANALVKDDPGLQSRLHALGSA